MVPDLVGCRFLPRLPIKSNSCQDIRRNDGAFGATAGQLARADYSALCAAYRSQQTYGRDETCRKWTVKEIALPPHQRTVVTRGSCHRPSFSPVENGGQSTLSQETVGRRLLGHAKSPTYSDQECNIRFTARDLEKTA